MMCHVGWVTVICHMFLAVLGWGTRGKIIGVKITASGESIHTREPRYLGRLLRGNRFHLGKASVGSVPRILVTSWMQVS